MLPMSLRFFYAAEKAMIPVSLWFLLIPAMITMADHSLPSQQFAQSFLLSNTDHSPLALITGLPGTTVPIVSASENERRQCPSFPRRSIRRLPLTSRSAYCPFERVTNVDAQRLPMVLDEIRCLCTNPPSATIEKFTCQPLQYTLPVLVMDRNTSQYKMHTQNLNLACIAMPIVQIKDDDDNDEDSDSNWIRLLQVSYTIK